MIPTTADDATMERYVSNILAAYDRATPAQLARGRCWYHVAHDMALIIGNGDVRKGAGILAALSPNKTWDLNVRLATDAGNGSVHGHLSTALRKTERILEGEDPADVLPMDAKTGHFFRCIVDPDDPDPVTVDRHAHDIAVGEVYGNRDRGLSNKKRYATLAMAYRLAGRRRGEIPSRMQAVPWGMVIEAGGFLPLGDDEE